MMRRHPHFDLWLHDDRAIADRLGVAIIARTTIHEWPLSQVQRLHTADGATHIYKVQAQPTVEPQFYRAARSPLLPRVQVLASDGTPPNIPEALLCDDLGVTLQANPPQDTHAVLDVARTLQQQIAQIAGELPARADIRTEAAWARYGATLVATVAELIAAWRFQLLGPSHLTELRAMVELNAVIDAIRSPGGYVHGDLKWDNIIVANDGYRVLDWQRPIWGPHDLDLVALLTNARIPPQQHVDTGVVRLHYLLLIGWFAEAAARWFPAAADAYDATISRILKRLRTLDD